MPPTTKNREAEGQKLAELTAGLLDTAYRYGKWRPWLRECADFMNCESVSITRWDLDRPAPGFSVSNADDEAPLEWRTWFCQLLECYIPSKPCIFDELLNKLAEHAEFDSDIAELLKTAPQLPGTVKLGFVWWNEDIAVLLFRRADNIPWTELDDTNLQFLTKQIHQTLLINRHIYDQRRGNAIAAALLNTSPRGMAIVDEFGRVGFCSLRTRELLDKNDGLGIENGLLNFHNKEQQAEFLNSAKTFLEEGSSTLSLSIDRPSGKANLQFMVVALKTMSISQQYFQTQAFLTIYLHDPTEQAQLNLEHLQRYFGLTTAEAKVAINLFEQDNLQTAAEALGISINTARTHLRRIYRKVGVSGQPELMRALTSVLNANLIADQDDINVDLEMFTHVRNFGSVRKV